MSATNDVPRRRGRPRKWASDAERVQAWRAAERARRELLRDHPDVGGLVDAVRRAEAQRDGNWRQVLELQLQVRQLSADPPAESVTDASVLALRQQVDDLSAVVAQLLGAGWDHPVFATVAARARRADAEGRLLERSVLDELEMTSAPAPLPASMTPRTVTSPGLSRAERRRLEREERRRRY